MHLTAKWAQPKSGVRNPRSDRYEVLRRQRVPFYSNHTAHVSAGQPAVGIGIPTDLAGVWNTPDVDLTWTAPADDDNPVASYDVFRDNQFIGNVAIAEYTDADIVEGPTYAYQVRAVDDEFNRGQRTEPVDVATSVLKTIEDMSVQELKDFLDANGIDRSGVTLKSELLALAQTV